MKNKNLFYLVAICSLVLFIANGHFVHAFSAQVYGVTSSFKDSGSETGGIPNSPDINESYRITDAGDVNNDGYNDILIGVPGEFYGSGLGYGGAAYLLYGSAEGFEDINLATAIKFSTGDSGYDAVGAVVSGLGDVNGDGFDDFAIASTGSNGSQAVSVFFGKAEEYTSRSIETADSVMSVGGAFADYRFGSAIAEAGDINNDGFSDIMVSSPFLVDGNGEMAGSTYVIFGRSTWNQNFILENNSQPLANAVVKITGDHAAGIDNFGYAVSGKADIDSDGKSDIAIGAPNISDDTDNGSVFVVYGKDILPNAGTVAITSLANKRIVDSSVGSGLGTAVSFEGDVDGSGKNDLVIGAPYYIKNVSQRGAVYMLYDDVVSGITVNTTHTLTTETPHFLGESTGDLLGTVLGQGGDINGDGYDDLTMLTLWDTNHSAYVAYGSATQHSGEVVLSDVTHNVNGVVEYSGVYMYALTIIQHSNNDSFDDLVLYTSYQPSPSIYGSVLYIAGSNSLTGTSTLPDTVTAHFDAEPAVEKLGNSAADAGDINNDGVADFLLGAPYDYGKTYMVFGVNEMYTDTFVEKHVVFLGEQSNDQSGFAVAGGQDVTGDDFDDSVVTAPYSDRGATDAGAAYIVFGGENVTDIQLQDANQIITDTAAGAHFGWSAKYIPNLDGDAIPELAISAPDDSSGNGAVYIFYGSTVAAAGSTLTTAQADIVIRGQSGEAAGTALAVLPDMNGDSKEELLIGAPSADTSAGKAYILYSSTMLNTLNPTTGDANITFTGEAANDKAGFAVGTAGDINADGFEDILIGAPQSEWGSGKGYLVYGRASFSASYSLSAANYIFTGETAGSGTYNGSQAGFSLAGYDADQDGYSDVVIGAPAPLSSSTPEPKSFFIHGKELDADIAHSTTMELNSTNAAELLGQNNDQLGWSTTVVSDIRNDIHRPYLLLGAPCGQFPQTCNPVVYGMNVYTDVDQDNFNGSPFVDFPYATDCDDTVDTTNPDAPEICDDTDNNCNGENNEGLPTYSSYPDSDGDAYGDQAAVAEVSCIAAGYYVEDNTDCRDDVYEINPGATEQCNGDDDNCDGNIDEGFPELTLYVDGDGDGYGDPLQPVVWCSEYDGYVTDNTDCRDDVYEINPGAIDIPNDGIDQDCSGEDATESTPTPTENQAPIFTGSLPSVSFFSGETTANVFNLNEYFSDPDGDQLQYTVEGDEDITVHIAEDGMVKFSADSSFVGEEKMIFYAHDPSNAAAQSNRITVSVAQEVVDIPDGDDNTGSDNCADANGIDTNQSTPISHITGTSRGKGIITVYGTNTEVIRCWETFPIGGVVPRLGAYKDKIYVFSVKKKSGTTVHIENIYGEKIQKRKLSKRLHRRTIAMGQLDGKRHTQEIVFGIKRGSTVYMKVFTFNYRSNRTTVKRMAKYRNIKSSSYHVSTKNGIITMKNKRQKKLFTWQPF